MYSIRISFIYGYMPNIISTIVDVEKLILVILGYMPNIISTIVDITPFNYYLKRAICLI